jgi:hypothetical protein
MFPHDHDGPGVGSAWVREWGVGGQETTMDVHTGEVDYRSDPSDTAVVPASGGTAQGRLFDDPGGYSFANTDQLPVVGRERRRSDPYGPPRWLRFMVVLVVIGILAAGAALALVKTGVIGKSSVPSAGGGHAAQTTTPPTRVIHTKTLLTPAQTIGGSGAGNYTISARAFVVTVTTGLGRSWVSIGIVGQTPIFQGIVPPNTSQRELLLGPAQVSIGAGATTMTVTAGHKSQTVTPPSAPFTYQITPAG